MEGGRGGGQCFFLSFEQVYLSLPLPPFLILPSLTPARLVPVPLIAGYPQHRLQGNRRTTGCGDGRAHNTALRWLMCCAGGDAVVGHIEHRGWEGRLGGAVGCRKP